MNNQELWEAVLGEVELSLSKASFTTWFKSTSIKNLTEDSLTVIVPNIFAKEWLEKKYQKIILDSIRKHFPKINRMNCSLETQDSFKKSLDSVVTSPVLKEQVSKTILEAPVSKKETWVHSGLNARYTFETYVVGANNELAYAACQSVCKDPGKSYNPLFIYGDVGLGKTHLIQATGNFIKSQNPDLKIRYVSMERFANELIGAIQNSKAKEFKNEYIQLDVLIIDDVQFLSKKEKTQEEFFHVFESLYQLNKQIIISADRPPKSISTLENRLKSRFEGGMMADINKPDLETRLAIIKRKLAEKEFSLEDKIIEYLAKNIYHNIRELEGALNKIIITYQLRNTLPDLKGIIELTEDLISSNRQNKVTPKVLVKAIADFFNIKSQEIMGSCRKKTVIKPRQLAFYLLREDLSLSFTEIGSFLGGKNHSTVMYSHKKIIGELKNNKFLQDQIKFIREKYNDY
ncbi:MAG: chromosomal replication initiator protein DnaA [Candidatus Moranbacteria bacterium]|nr:chromosomal replication initiator protein DnaA [Candidatus Moranbacteria bacterium]